MYDDVCMNSLMHTFCWSAYVAPTDSCTLSAVTPCPADFATAVFSALCFESSNGSTELP